jgi:hypothetical protein
MRCIYCGQPSDSSVSVPHAFPEALYRGGPAFPVGVICDKCNHYLGKELETMLVQHPVLSMQLQSYGLPGKKGVRKKLGIVERLIEDRSKVRFPIRKPIPRYNKDGIRIGFSVSPIWNPNFDMDRFSRGLHMLAFNMAILKQGIETAFELRYDRVRNYVRRPHKGERWPFLQVIRPHNDIVMPPLVSGKNVDDAEIVQVDQFNLTCMVDLQNTGMVSKDRMKIEGENISWEIIDSKWLPPVHEPHIENGLQHHYRVVIG